MNLAPSPQLARVAVFALLSASFFTAWMPRALAQSPASQNIEDEARRAERERRQREERDDRYRRLLQRFIDYTQETAELCATLETKATSFTKRCNDLLKNDDGKRLAATDTGFYAYIRLREQATPSVEQIQARRRAIDGILETVRAETKRDFVGFLPADSVQREVSELHEEAKRWLGLVAENEGWLDSAITKAPKDLNLATAATLEATVKQYEAQRLSLWAKARNAGEQKAQEQSTREVEEKARMAELDRGKQEAEQLYRAAKAALESERADFEARVKQQDLETKRQLAEAEVRYQDEVARLKRQVEEAAAKRKLEDTKSEIENEKISKEADKRKLIEKSKNPEVQALLAPFLTKGYWQPGEKSGSNIDLKPISYSKLTAFGALQPTSDGIQKLLRVATKDAYYGALDKVRPRWSYSPVIGRLSAAQLEEVKKAQAYLIEMGQVMVEQGLLSE